MELRRALLLFAIVLGVAAIVTSVSNPSGREGDEARPQAEPRSSDQAARAGPGDEGPVIVRFDSEGGPRRALVGAGRPATVTVSVDSPGEVRLEGLGLSAPAARLTPARFDLLPAEGGRHPVRFTPAAKREARTIGLLLIEPSR